MPAYYNEHDPKAAAWLRELIAHNLIAPGQVDERSIADVVVADLSGFSQCHFFAGIGGWSYALRLAGWPDDRPVWTGSCPCQPFSAAGKQLGEKDPRHLWPEFLRLIDSECAPASIFGEQVASAAGRLWLAGVRADLEKLGYAVGAADLCAAGLGAPHIRQRLFWMAHAAGERRAQHERESWNGLRSDPQTDNSAERDWSDRLADLQQPRLERHAGNGDHGHEPGRLGADAPRSTPASGCAGGLGDSNGEGCSECSELDRDAKQSGFETPLRRNANRSSAWDRYELVHCRDGKTRRFEPESFPLDYGIPNRMGLLRGYGNANRAATRGDLHRSL